QAGLSQMRIGQRLARSQHGLAGNAGLAEAPDPCVARLGVEDRPPTHRSLVQGTRDLVLVVSLSAGLVAQNLDEGGVHALASEPDLDELAVGAPIQEIGEGRA